jgi:hypothetical protein
MKFFFADEGNRSAIFLSHFMDSFQQVSICPNMDVAEVPLSSLEKLQVGELSSI